MNREVDFVKRHYMGRLVLLLLAGIIPVIIAGCGGGSFEWPKAIEQSSNVPDSDTDTDTGGDTNTGGDDTSDNGDTVPPDTSNDTRFAGYWLASFGDEYASDGVEYEYAIRLHLKRNIANRLSGSADVVRFYRLASGDSDWEDFDADVVDASRKDDYAQLELEADEFDVNPSLYLRSAGDQLVGLFVILDGSGLVRASSVTWHKISSGSIEGDWAASFRDSRSLTDSSLVDSGVLRDRRAGATFTSGASKAKESFTGSGDFVELRDTDMMVYLGYDVKNGEYNGTRATFTFDQVYSAIPKVVIPDAPMNWDGFYGQGLYAGVFEQWNPSKQLTRFGHALWYRQDDTFDTTDVNGTWITAFSDTVAADGEPKSFIVSMKLTLGSSSALDATNATIRQELGKTDSSYVTLSGLNESMEAKGDIHLELTGGGEQYIWDLYLIGDRLVGSYQRLSSTEVFRGRGVAEWRRTSNKSVAGTWAASFNDARSPGASNYVPGIGYMDIGDAQTSGNGNVLIAGDEAPLSFTTTVAVDNNKVDFVWQGKLSGLTEWHVRRAGSVLLGTYTNYNEADEVEARGHAFWYQTDSED